MVQYISKTFSNILSCIIQDNIQITNNCNNGIYDNKSFISIDNHIMSNKPHNIVYFE